MGAGGVGEVSPKDAWEAMASSRPTLMIDVRTSKEWSMIGVPDLSSLDRPMAFIEWQSFPTMAVNHDFAEEALEAADQTNAEEIYFICKSGVRSMHAAMTTSAAAAAAGRELKFFNVVEGFEGDPYAQVNRGELTGWKANGLPWRHA